MYSPVESTASESTNKKSKKIRIYLSCEQRQLLRQWIGVARFTYNRTVEYLQQPDTKANWRAIKGDILSNLPEWAKPVPYQIKSIAVRDACIAVREAKAKYSKTGQFQQVKFKSRKNPVQSCYVPKSAVSAKGVYHTKLGQIKFSEPLPEGFGDCRLVAVRGQHYLCLPVDAPKHKSENKHRIVALDPGVRNFLTLFSENSFGWIGSNDMGRIQRLCHHLDDLISRLTKAKSQTKQRMKKAANRLRSKIRNLIDELHHKTALFLVQNFDVILLPTFEVSQMIAKSSRKIRSKSVRQMLNWAHYRFEVFLKHKAAEYNKVVVDVSEAYTSKTVSWTGEILNNLGGKKVVAGSDGFRLNRDLNGARGIFIKSVVEHPSLTLGDTPSVI
ncbi:RNA-guided endonuclease InsQ/TnpB family protein [Dapis sp. BLCC M126]|uniref:RNA-guided endonuclease InsQ/TnpB family protein n=1 Tax=Dapis sp. BLCC M126 TaxID=3400189 RepID=UPI003CFB4D1D